MEALQELDQGGILFILSLTLRSILRIVIEDKRYCMSEEIIYCSEISLHPWYNAQVCSVVDNHQMSRKKAQICSEDIQYPAEVGDRMEAAGHTRWGYQVKENFVGLRGSPSFFCPHLHFLFLSDRLCHLQGFFWHEHSIPGLHDGALEAVDTVTNLIQGPDGNLVLVIDNFQWGSVFLMSYLSSYFVWKDERRLFRKHIKFPFTR